MDTTLRDGEQSPGVNLNEQEKLQIARQLERLGFMLWKLALQQLPKGFSIGKTYREYNSKCYSYEFS